MGFEGFGEFRPSRIQSWSGPLTAFWYLMMERELKGVAGEKPGCLEVVML